MKITKAQLDVIMEAIDDFVDALPDNIIEPTRSVCKATISDLKYHIISRFESEDEAMGIGDDSYHDNETNR
jgi:hypothetical protein